MNIRWTVTSYEIIPISPTSNRKVYPRVLSGCYQHCSNSFLIYHSYHFQTWNLTFTRVVLLADSKIFTAILHPSSEHWTQHLCEGCFQYRWIQTPCSLLSNTTQLHRLIRIIASNDRALGIHSHTNHAYKWNQSQNSQLESRKRTVPPTPQITMEQLYGDGCVYNLANLSPSDVKERGKNSKLSILSKENPHERRLSV
jgi:hypothetical protein